MLSTFSDFHNLAIVVSMLIVIGVTAAALVLFFTGRLTRVFTKFRGTRVVTCPETKRDVGVKVDALHAAWSSTSLTKPELRLKDCTRWPERAGCGQECLAQIEQSPEDCLVRTIVARFYEHAHCTFCSEPVRLTNGLEQQPGLLDKDGQIRRWNEVAAEHLRETLDTAAAVCARCAITERFRLEHPELVIDRRR